MTLRQLGYIDKPILLLDTDGYWQPFLRLVEQVVGEGFAERDSFGLIEVAPTAAAALDRVAALLGSAGGSQAS
jgi:predicted Rossmann-fold nucleotide-binding protein